MDNLRAAQVRQQLGQLQQREVKALQLVAYQQQQPHRLIALEPQPQVSSFLQHRVIRLGTNPQQPEERMDNLRAAQVRQQHHQLQQEEVKALQMVAHQQQQPRQLMAKKPPQQDNSFRQH